MRALTFIRPWDTAIVHLGKLVENRSWAPPQSLLGERFAIHSGKGWDADGEEFLRKLVPAKVLAPELGRARAVAGAIIATVRLVRSFAVEGSPDPLARSPWCFGPIAWVLDEVRVLRAPVPCRGYLGLWRLSPELEAAVRAQE